MFEIHSKCCLCPKSGEQDRLSLIDYPIAFIPPSVLREVSFPSLIFKFFQKMINEFPIFLKKIVVSPGPDDDMSLSGLSPGKMHFGPCFLKKTKIFGSRRPAGA